MSADDKWVKLAASGNLWFQIAPHWGAFQCGAIFNVRLRVATLVYQQRHISFLL